MWNKMIANYIKVQSRRADMEWNPLDISCYTSYVVPSTDNNQGYNQRMEAGANSSDGREN